MIQEKIVVGAGGEFPLDGLLTIPGSGGASYPAVVLVHGSGVSAFYLQDMGKKQVSEYLSGIAKPILVMCRVTVISKCLRKQNLKNINVFWNIIRRLHFSFIPD